MKNIHSGLLGFLTKTLNHFFAIKIQDAVIDKTPSESKFKE